MLKQLNDHQVRCTDCGAMLDPGERCDCERLNAERRKVDKQAKTQAIIAHNLEMMEQATKEWEWS